MQNNEGKKISVCITTYNRSHETIAAFERILTDNRVDDIVIVDDHSNPSKTSELNILLNQLRLHKDSEKIYFFRNSFNLGCYKNKGNAVEMAKNENVIIFDSDNILTTDYLDAIYPLDWETSAAFLPSFARPTFDYRHLAGTYNRNNLNALITKPNAFTLLNTMNFFVNKKAYLKAFVKNIEPLNADSLFINYNLLRNGESLTVVPGLEYFHLIHKGSHFQQHQRKGASLVSGLERNIKMLANTTKV